MNRMMKNKKKKHGNIEK